MQAYTCSADIAMKTIARVIPTTTNHWVGDGFFVKPVFNDMAFTKDISPFLMFDYAAPKEFAPSIKRRGVGVHPHRGFETVTIAVSSWVLPALSTAATTALLLLILFILFSHTSFIYRR